MTFARAFRVVIVVWFAAAVVAGAWSIAEAGPGAASSCSTACQQRVFTKHRLRTVEPYRPFLARLRACESSGNYLAVNPSGTYTGAYQFDIPTWRSVGGRGIPRDASKLEQDYRAVKLYRQRGVQPWPTCGPRASRS